MLEELPIGLTLAATTLMLSLLGAPWVRVGHDRSERISLGTRWALYSFFHPVAAWTIRLMVLIPLAALTVMAAIHWWAEIETLLALASRMVQVGRAL